MKDKSQIFRKIIWIAIFALAMAYLESAVVVYLRHLYGITDYTLGIPYFNDDIAIIEIGREIATLAMIMAVGWAVGKSFQDRLGYAFLVFGIWDIFYYFWLWVFVKWPSSLFETDLLFLIPLPWWGPVIAPILIASLMVIGGVYAVYYQEKGTKIRFFMLEWALFISGIVLLLYTFMEDAVAILPANVETLSQLRPSSFNWGIYILGFLFLSSCLYHSIISTRDK